jgi:hypothetical protein
MSAKVDGETVRRSDILSELLETAPVQPAWWVMGDENTYVVLGFPTRSVLHAKHMCLAK